MKKFSFVLSIIALLFVACEKTEDPVEIQLLGSWEFGDFTDAGEQYLKKVNNIDKDKMGITFEERGKCTVRSFFGFCATPPITYDDKKGTWEKVDEVLLITTENWDGEDHIQQWKIVLIENKTLVIKYL